MSTAPSLDDVLAAARSAGAAGAWSTAYEQLAPHAPLYAGEPAYALASAEAALRTGHPSEAQRWATSAASAPARVLSTAARAQAANYAGAASLALGDLDAAERAFGEALELGTAAGADLPVARALNNLAIIADIRGRRDDALSLYESALPVYQRIGNIVGLAETFHNIGLALRHQARWERADESERRAAEYARELGNVRLEEMARVGRAEISLAQGDHALAEAASARAAGAFAALGQAALEADALRVMAVARVRRGDAAGARPPLERAVELAEWAEDRLVLAECLLGRAECALALRDTTAARADATEAVRLFEMLGAAEPLADARALLAGA